MFSNQAEMVVAATITDKGRQKEEEKKANTWVLGSVDALARRKKRSKKDSGSKST